MNSIPKKVPRSSILKIKEILLQKFVNLQKWLFLESEFTNSHNILKTKEKTPTNGVLHMRATLTGFTAYGVAFGRTRRFHFLPEIPQLKISHTGELFNWRGFVCNLRTKIFLIFSEYPLRRLQRRPCSA